MTDDDATAIEIYSSQLRGLQQAERDRAAVYRARSAAYGHLGLWKESLEDSIFALRINPFSAESLVLRANAEKHLKQVDAALISYLTVVEMPYGGANVDRQILLNAQEALVDLATAKFAAETETARQSLERLFDVTRESAGRRECLEAARDETLAETETMSETGQRLLIFIFEANARFHINDLSSAKACYHAALLVPAGDEPEVRAMVLYQLSSLYTDVYATAIAVTMANESYHLYEQLHDLAGMGRALHAIGRAYLSGHGSCKEAEKPLHAALEIAEKTEDADGVSNICRDIINSIHDKSSPLWHRATELLRRSCLHVDIAASLQERCKNLQTFAVLEAEFGAYADAEKHIEEAEKLLDSDANRLSCQQHMSTILLAQQKTARCKAMLLDVVAVAERMPQNPAAFVLMGRLWGLCAADADADVWYRKAKLCARASLDASARPAMTIVRGIFAVQNKDYPKAIRCFQKATESFREKRSTDISAVFASSITMRRRCNAFAQFAHIELGEIVQALEIADSGRAQSLSEKVSWPPSGAPEREEFSLEKALLLARRATIAVYSVLLDRPLKRTYIWVIPCGCTSLGDIRFFDVKLPPEASTSSVVTAEKGSRSLLFEAVVDRGEDACSNYRTFKIDDVQASAENEKKIERCYEELLEPIETLLPAVSECAKNARFVIVPQENLYSVPFAALQRKNGARLVDACDVLIAPSLRSLHYLSAKRNQCANEGNNLVFAPKIPPGLSHNGVPVRPLPEAEKEGEAVGRLLDAKVLTDEATKTRVLESLPAACVIHFATHSLVDVLTDEGFTGALVVAAPPEWNGDIHPCLLRGCEIQQLDLSNVKLVVLACCHSAGGTTKAEGVLGLGRAFLFAGVRSVVVSMWPVPDTSATRRLMENFYARFLRSHDAPNALRGAMLDASRSATWSTWAGYYVLGGLPFLEEP